MRTRSWSPPYAPCKGEKALQRGLLRAFEERESERPLHLSDPDSSCCTFM